VVIEAEVQDGIHHPGMESRAPERTETSNGIAEVSPNFVPMIFSMKAIPSLDWDSSALG